MLCYKNVLFTIIDLGNRRVCMFVRVLLVCVRALRSFVSDIYHDFLTLYRLFQSLAHKFLSNKCLKRNHKYKIKTFNCRRNVAGFLSILEVRGSSASSEQSEAEGHDVEGQDAQEDQKAEQED